MRWRAGSCRVETRSVSIFTLRTWTLWQPSSAMKLLASAHRRKSLGECTNSPFPIRMKRLFALAGQPAFAGRKGTRNETHPQIYGDDARQTPAKSTYGRHRPALRNHGARRRISRHHAASNQADRRRGPLLHLRADHAEREAGRQPTIHARSGG